MLTSWNGNIFHVTGHLCGEFTGHRWIPLHKGQWRWALMCSLICAWINGWVNNYDAGDLRCHHAHYDVSVMFSITIQVSWKFCFAVTPFLAIICSKILHTLEMQLPCHIQTFIKIWVQNKISMYLNYNGILFMKLVGGSLWHKELWHVLPDQKSDLLWLQCSWHNAFR